MGIIRKSLLQVGRRRKGVVHAPAGPQKINRHFAFNSFLNVKLAELDAPHGKGEWLPWKRAMAEESARLTSEQKKDYLKHPEAKRRGTGSGRLKQEYLESYQDVRLNQAVDEQSP